MPPERLPASLARLPTSPAPLTVSLALLPAADPTPCESPSPTLQGATWRMAPLPAGARADAGMPASYRCAALHRGRWQRIGHGMRRQRPTARAARPHRTTAGVDAFSPDSWRTHVHLEMAGPFHVPPFRHPRQVMPRWVRVCWRHWRRARQTSRGLAAVAPSCRAAHASRARSSASAHPSGPFAWQS
jgi:hypothetical protein